MNKFRKYQRYTKWVILLLVVALVALIVLNRDWIRDFWRGVTYRPSSVMAEIREDLDLTGHGEFLFNASQPVLSEKDDFNDRKPTRTSFSYI